MTELNTVEMGVAVGEAEIGRVPEARGFVVSCAGLLRELGCFVDSVHRAVADGYRHLRAFDDRRSGAGGEQPNGCQKGCQEGCNAGAALLPEPHTAYLCQMIHNPKNLLAGR